MNGWVWIRSIRSSLATSMCAPGADIFFESVGGLSLKVKQRLLRGDGLRRIGGHLDLHVLRLLGGIIARQRHGRGRGSRNNTRFGDQLRRRTVGIEVAQYAIHAGLGKCDVVVRTSPSGCRWDDRAGRTADPGSPRTCGTASRGRSGNLCHRTILPRIVDRKLELASARSV